MLRPQHAQSSEQLPERRVAALRSVEVQQKLHAQFAEKYGFIDNHGNSDIDSALHYLKETFFKQEQAEPGKYPTVTVYHLTQVITVALETDLNPFTNDLYGKWTAFGDLKVFATMDGWMKIATSEAITKRDFIYSPTMTTVEINGVQYNVPEWIECQLEHKEKGISHAREFFLEVFNNSQHHLPSWSRPARMLSHVAFIQALRRMLRISSLCDSDMIVDMTKEYEALSMQQKSVTTAAVPVQQNQTASNANTRQYQSSAPTATAKPNRQLNVSLDDVEIVTIGAASKVNADSESTDAVEQETNVDTAEVSPVDTQPTNQPVSQEVGTPEVKQEASSPEEENVASVPEQPVCKEEAAVSDPVEVNELMVNRTIVQIVKPFIENCKCGRISIEQLIEKRVIITDELGRRWFDQEVNKLR